MFIRKGLGDISLSDTTVDRELSLCVLRCDWPRKELTSEIVSRKFEKTESSRTRDREVDRIYFNTE